MHKAHLVEASPPFRRGIARTIHSFDQTLASLLSQLSEILTGGISLRSVLGVRDEASQSEVPVPRDGEVLDRELEEVLISLTLAGGTNGNKALLDVEGQVDEHSVSSALDFVVPEENVGFEEIQSLINDVFLISYYKCYVIDC